MIIYSWDEDQIQIKAAIKVQLKLKQLFLDQPSAGKLQT